MWLNYLLKSIHSKFKRKKAYFTFKEASLCSFQSKYKKNSHELSHKLHQKKCLKLKRSKKLIKKNHQKEALLKVKSQKTLASTLFKKLSHWLRIRSMKKSSNNFAQSWMLRLRNLENIFWRREQDLQVWRLCRYFWERRGKSRSYLGNFWDGFCRRSTFDTQ